MPLAFRTAHYGLSTLVRPGVSQSILLRAAGGAVVGRATILIAQRLGYPVVVIVSSESERESLVRDFDLLPKCDIFDEQSTLRVSVLEQARSNSVDALLSFNAKPLTEEELACVAPPGSILQMADPSSSSQSRKRITTIPPAHDLTRRFLDLKSLIQQKHLDASLLQADIFRSGENDLIQFERSTVSRPIGKIADAL